MGRDGRIGSWCVLRRTGGGVISLVRDRLCLGRDYSRGRQVGSLVSNRFGHFAR